jgi:hypothetical protein
MGASVVTSRSLGRTAIASRTGDNEVEEDQMPAPIPLPGKIMEMSMEFWRRVLLQTERAREGSVETPSPHESGGVKRRDKDSPPDIW